MDAVCRPGPSELRKLQAVTAGRVWDEAKNVASLGDVSSPVPLIVAGESSCKHGSTRRMPGSVSFLGVLEENDLFALFRESDLYICTSIYEPFGLAPLEAALCGCAILANDIPSLREVWGEGALYFVDAPSLSTLLTHLANDREAIVAAQARSRARAGLYTREKMAASYLHGLLKCSGVRRTNCGGLMSHKLRIAYFAHSLRSDWNNGNAHFLRGLLRSLGEAGHDVTVFEPADNWSILNLRAETSGEQSLQAFAEAYSDLSIRAYDLTTSGEAAIWRGMLEGIDIVVVHEWNPPELAHVLLTLRDEMGFRILFHDTHHRASSSPAQIELFRIDRFDGVLVFGEVLRNIYRDKFDIQRVWTLHEAADTSVFKPQPHVQKTHDVVWIGNWGDDERSAEIKRFFLHPAAALPELRFAIYGVRYPEEGLAALRKAGATYCGYLPNLSVPLTYAASRLTVHIPRQQYATVMTGIPTIRVFEALACGIPLISAPWSDSEHLFREGDFIPVRDSDEMRRAIEYLIHEPDAASAQAARGLETILAHHTCKHRAQQLSTLLLEQFS